MIGIFDSGFGGLQTLTYFRRFHPQYDYIFLADQHNYPYGQKTPQEIKKYTFAALQRLFEKGAKIVIVACNTAAAYAIRPRQQEYPNHKALSITIPGLEKIIQDTQKYQNIAVLATQATFHSNIYYTVFDSLGGTPGTKMTITVATDLVDIVEKGITDPEKRIQVIKPYIDEISKEQTDCLILGCTHFPILLEQFQELYKGEIIDPAYEAAQQFGPYLNRHPEIQKELATNASVQVYTTADPVPFSTTGKYIMPDLPTPYNIILQY